MSPSGQMLRNFIGSNGSTNRATSGPSGPGWGLPSAVAREFLKMCHSFDLFF